MDRETAKEELKNREPDFLEKAPQRVNGHASYICPVCGNGNGTTGDGIAIDPHRKDKRYKCFKCGLNEDVIGLWKLHYGITDDREAFKGLYNYYGITVDTAQEDFKPEYQKQAKNEQYTHNSIHTDTYTQKKEESKIGYFKACMGHITETDYLKKRGISNALASKYMLGYDPNYSKGTGGKTWKALIIPTGTSSYVARNTDPEAIKKDRYRKNGSSQIYNTGAIKDNLDKPVFVVEGELDAISIVEVGGEAVALGSTANYRQLLSLIQEHKPAHTLILALDNDEDGRETTGTLEKELESLEIPFYRCNPYGKEKDANGALLASREDFTEEIRRATEEALGTEREEPEAQKKEYLNTSTANHLQDFINGITDSVNTPYIPTGFRGLDTILEGGLYEGLYFMGAISSLGKTTLALQIMDQIAQAGNDVLIFSLEMARSELMSKSISRLTLLDILQNNGNIQDAKTTRGITTGSRYKNYSQEERELIQRAITTYGSYAKNIYIHEGMGDIGVQQVREAISKHILFTGKKPVVLIDYVQILAPADIRATDKQNTDKAVLELKRLSRDFKIPVIGISSFNRANYGETVKMNAFKESGSIEYGSDVLIGLQLKGAGQKDKPFDVDEAKRKNPREVELVILKNRNGATGNKISYEYYPLFNYFKEA